MPPFTPHTPTVRRWTKYGSDKPDLRIRPDCAGRVQTFLADCGFGPFAGNVVKAVVADGLHRVPRKQIDKL